MKQCDRDRWQMREKQEHFSLLLSLFHLAESLVLQHPRWEYWKPTCCVTPCPSSTLSPNSATSRLNHNSFHLTVWDISLFVFYAVLMLTPPLPTSPLIHYKKKKRIQSGSESDSQLCVVRPIGQHDHNVFLTQRGDFKTSSFKTHDSPGTKDKCKCSKHLAFN